MKKITLILSLVLVFFVIGIILGGELFEHTAQEKHTRDVHKSIRNIENKVVNEQSNYIDDMTINEKIGQLIIGGITGTTLTTEMKSLINDYELGGFIFYADNFTTEDQAKKLVEEIISENENNPIPQFLSVDQEGGKYTRLPNYHLPINAEIGEINDPEYAFFVGQKAAKQLQDYELNMNFSPVLDINSNPQNPVINRRSYGDNSEIVSKLGIQTMRGIQSEKIVSVIKHFPGHGDTSVDSHLELPVVNKNLEELEQLELIPFRHAIQEGADVVMVAHILLPFVDPDYPATMSKEIITNLLRKNIGFNGVVVTDDMTMDAIAKHYNIGQAAVESIKAGSDLILVAHEYTNIVDTIESIKLAVEQGEISEERIDESVLRIIELKKKYGIIE
ncbi:glycoside hydrolase family 3 protein [Ornithinibacillus halophilus]|uniref:Beta-N-acetylhexosaminidase n=1 Tax=Ornithinibacillus halophilus TaxID=930117 RepID=A0A1M5KP37_9BACI|nr:glycoside hydrolase family 3 N-terminal domain-containing protein [Ornithinibacillus halophilus]SHG54547.1 beta-N-acetylhexosaminidase [Ornithinibacillus halophilus]